MPTRTKRASHSLVVALRRTLWTLLKGIVGGLLVALVVVVYQLESRTDLEIWHTADLDAEFSTKSGVESFEEYLELEARLFRQLDERVYAAQKDPKLRQIDRYTKGTLADPGRWPQNWNRSFTLPSESPSTVSVSSLNLTVSTSADATSVVK